MNGLGVDLVEIARVDGLLKRHGDRFRARLFTAGELAMARREGANEAAVLAARWAAKEAFVKALGPRAAEVPLREIEVTGGGPGAPSLRACGAAAVALTAAGARVAFVSLTRSDGNAAALVVLA